MGRAASSATLSLVAGLVFAGSAAADTFIPTRLDDPAPPNKCKLDDCSLREAIKAANNRAGLDEVLLGKGTYELEILPVDGGANEDGQLVAVDSVTISGLGPRETRIDANGIDRVLAMGGKSILQGVTVKGGDAGANPFHSSNGGGILGVGQRIALKNVVVKQNAALFGGGVSMFGPKMTIRNSTIAQNNAGEGGGIDLRALFVQTLMEIRSSTISGNTAGKGGGILADGFAPSTQIPPILDIDNSTVAGNDASGQGGGVFGDNDAIVVLDNTTVAYNMADSDNSGGGVGGGIHQFNGASFQFNDSVLALNTVGSSGSGPACHGSFSDGGSLVDATGTNPNCNFVGLFQPTVTTTPLIGPLADNGGPTKTVKLLSGSPAIGLSLGCPNLDQRGKDRPEDGCDAGSFERKGP
ncbi:MAG: choice-of-anchor Q domain-containing protein [Solirubrobacterales bacterium]